MTLTFLWLLFTGWPVKAAWGMARQIHDEKERR